MKVTKNTDIRDLVIGLKEATRIAGSLENVGYFKVGELTKKTAYELSKIRNFGKESLRQLIIRLEDNGFSLAPPTLKDKNRSIVILSNIISELLKERGRKNDGLDKRARGMISRVYSNFSIPSH